MKLTDPRSMASPKQRMITTALNPLDSSRTYPALRVPGILNQSLGPVRAAAALRVVRGQHSAAEWASAEEVPGRVAPGDCSPGAPTDPLVPYRAYGLPCPMCGDMGRLAIMGRFF